ncbi:hypothetical protein GPECTOR_7g1139 [Gonium pectorale]|uniref:Smr domain-containing protein n=1 Tax=Gonium pectorale TaxID=33097 RepID=A0A150GTQ7_GONPE|nr:hypothetical protein GPECTOR_7g1139 [Gonium pectorale]|eukprot:KXZ53245.1 hypothetical protein GPECTOR_7g1139 [Gonium pectorale]
MGNSYSNSGPDPSAITGDPNDPDFWRRKGDAYAQARNSAFAASQAAYRSRDGARAKQLSEEGKRLAGNATEAHARAAALLLERNNASRAPSELDLHGLRVAEAVQAVEAALARARAAGLQKMVLIVGRGLHSEGGVSRLRPAVEGLVRRHNLRVTPGVPNQGCITVEFVSAAERGWVEWLFGGGCVIC